MKENMKIILKMVALSCAAAGAGWSCECAFNGAFKPYILFPTTAALTTAFIYGASIDAERKKKAIEKNMMQSGMSFNTSPFSTAQTMDTNSQGKNKQLLVSGERKDFQKHLREKDNAHIRS